MANLISYYRERGRHYCDFAVDDRDLVVNCTGQVVLHRPYVGSKLHGRLDYYLIYCVGGGLRIRLGGEEHFMRPGDMAIYPPNEDYWYEYSGKGELFYYWAHFTGSSAKEHILRAGLDIDKVITVGLDEDLASAFHSLMDAFLIIDAQHEGEAAGRLLVLLAALARAATNRSVRLAVERVRRSLSYMESRYSEPITVTELAAMEFMSVSHYNAIFRACTGFSPKEYLIRLRMNNAMEILTRTDLSVAQVAADVGCSDPQYFSRLFKKYIGLSPRAVRNASMPQASYKINGKLSDRDKPCDP